MNINRDNYEEYFLLYADNELTDSEKAEVLIFVKNNRDLEEEFRMILYTISKPEANVKLADKSFLFKNDSNAFINEENYEAIFVLYHDHELNAEQRSQTEIFLSAHPSLKEEFDLIGLARLSPENEVVFLNKKLLYKKEKAGKVVPLIFWKTIAAAVFIGFGLWGTLQFLSHPNRLPQASVSTVPAPKTGLANSDSVGTVKQGSNATARVTDLHDHSAGLNPNNAKEKKQKTFAAPQYAGTAIKEKQQETLQPVQIDSVVPVPESLSSSISLENQRIKNVRDEKITAINNIKPGKELVQNEMQSNSGETESAAKDIKSVSFNTDANDNDQNYVFYDVSADEFRKTKVGGFLKKVKRIIDRNNPINHIFSGNNNP